MVVAPAGNGTATDVTNASPYAVGSVVTLEAVATAGYGFRNWAATAGGFADTNAAQTTFTMPAQNVTITARFGPFAGGSGTQGDPYKIADWYHLHMVRNYLSNHFILVNNLSSTTAGYTALAGPAANGGKGWQPIGSLGGEPTIPVYINPFTGTFDGQGCETRDLFIDRPDEGGVGLFGAVGGGGVIEYIGVMGANVTGDWDVGVLVGGSAGDVSDCRASGSVNSISSIAGGLVGFNEGGTVSNSYSSGSVGGHDWVGGLLGASWYGSVSNCYAMGNVTCVYSQAGGLVAWNHYATVSNSYATGDVTGSRWIGGLVGSNYYGNVSNSHGSGSVVGSQYVGGLMGMNTVDTAVSDSYATGNVTGGDQAGGLVGTNGGNVRNCYSSGNVSGTEYIGGLMGYNGGNVSNCHATGIVTGDQFSGGLVGYNYGGTLSNSYATGNVTGTAGSWSTGGLVGWNSGAVYGCYATGNLTGYAVIGGLVGYSSPSGGLSNCYATGRVIGTYTGVGGLVGWNAGGTVSKSYSTGNVTGGASYAGGLVGQNDGTVSNSFWDTQTSGQGTSGGGTGKNTTEMKDFTTFSVAGWDIVTVVNSNTRNTGYIWNIVDDVTYAFLSWQPA